MKSISVLLFLFLTTALISCTFDSGDRSSGWSYSGITGISGEGPKVTQDISLDDFHAVSLSISGKVFLKQGNTQSVKVEAQKNVIANLITEVSGGKWRIRFDKNIRNHSGITIWITVPHLTEIGVSGSGDIIGETAFVNLGDFQTSISGSGNIEIEAEANSVAANISGAGDIVLSGKSESAEVRISGSGKVFASQLYTHTCDVKISGSGDASVNVSEALNVTISGSGDVYQQGKGKLKARISGSGDVIQE